MFDKDLIQYFIPLISVILGSSITLLGVYFTNRNSLKQLDKTFHQNELIKKRLLLQQKGEDLFKAIHEWKLTLFKYYFGLTSLFQKKAPIFTISSFLPEKSVDDSDFYLIDMYIKIYFPSLLPFYEDAFNKRGKIVKYIIDNKSKEPENRSSIDNFIKDQELFENSIEILKSKLAAEIQLL